MPHFPQLTTGVVGQYPLRRTRTTRTIKSSLADGRSVTLAEPQASTIQWDLNFEAMSEAEATSLQAHFDASQGRGGEFVFLDPAGNLLRWSEEFTDAVWIADPLLSIAAGIADPLAGTSAFTLTNVSGVEQRLTQTIDGNGGYFYCFSAWVRTSLPGTVTLQRSAGGTSQEELFRASGTWSRISTTGSLPVAAAQISFSIAVPSGQTVEVFGAQLEAQLAPSPYMRTFAESGVYTASRFAHDELTIICGGPDEYSARVRIVSNVQG
jgi:hypothetical protein